MPTRSTAAKARKKLKEGKSPSTAAGEFVHEEIEHVREGKHGARSTKQAIAIGLSKARQAGIPVKPKKKKAGSKKASSTSGSTSQKSSSKSSSGTRKAPSKKRSAASTRALKQESTKTTSKKALSRQAKSTQRRKAAAK